MKLTDGLHARMDETVKTAHLNAGLPPSRGRDSDDACVIVAMTLLRLVVGDPDVKRERGSNFHQSSQSRHPKTKKDRTVPIKSLRVTSGALCTHESMMSVTVTTNSAQPTMTAMRNGTRP